MCNAPRQQYSQILSQPEEPDDEEKAVSEQATLIQPQPSAAPADSPGISNFMRMAILLAVTVQNTGYALVRRYSRGHLGERYSTSSVLLVMEVAKIALSAQQIAFGKHPSDVPDGSALSKYWFLIMHSWKMVVPAVTYLVMNIMGFVALQHLDASTFSIIAQMKVFTTAVFSVLILGRKLHMRKWRALTTLVLGVILISNEAMPKASSSAVHDASSAEKLRSFAIGMAASFGDVVLSGFVSIYFEMVIKSKTETFSVWDRNLQLAFWSMLIYTPIMIHDRPSDPFGGWSWVTLLCAAVGALGGVLVALSIKYTDSIMKTIATTGSIVLTTALNASFLGGPFTLPIWTGALIVVVSVFNYNDRGDAD